MTHTIRKFAAALVLALLAPLAFAQGAFAPAMFTPFKKGGGSITSGSSIAPCTSSILYADAGSLLKCDPAAVVSGSVSTAGRSILTIQDTISGSSATSNFLNITGTFPATLSAETRGINLAITGDNDGQTQRGFYVNFVGQGVNAESEAAYFLYTGTHANSMTPAVFVDNQSIGGGGATLGLGARGLLNTASKLTIGVAGVGSSQNSAATMDMGGAFHGGGAGAGTTHIGVAGSAYSGATNYSGGYFFLTGANYNPFNQAPAPALSGQAALTVNNGSVAANIISLQDNGTLKWSAVDGGFIRQVEGHSFLGSNFTNATTTFSNTALSVNVENARKYRFTAALFVSTDVAADGSKIDFNGGSAAATNFVVTCVLSNAVGATLTQTAATSAALATALNIGALTNTAVHVYNCSGSFEPSGAGTFIIRAAQNAHTTGTLTVKRGSWVSLVDTP